MKRTARKIFCFLFLAFCLTTSVFAASNVETFVGTIDGTADPLPAGTAVMAFYGERICITNSDTTESIYLKMCTGATCTADATDADCTDGDGCGQIVIPPSTLNLCFDIEGVNKLSIDTTAGQTAAYVIVVVGS